MRRTAWWGWEDSNLQPNDYQPLALSIHQRPACGISWLRANSFKRKLYDALRAMEYAGFSPGITSGFRDDSKLFFVRIDPLPEDLASSGLFALNRKISVYVRLHGGAGRTRTSNQTVIAETRVNQGLALIDLPAEWSRQLHQMLGLPAR